MVSVLDINLFWFGDPESEEEVITDEEPVIEEDVVEEEEDSILTMDISKLEGDKKDAYLEMLLQFAKDKDEKAKKEAAKSRKRIQEIMEKKEKLRRLEAEKEEATLERKKSQEQWQEALKDIEPKYNLLKEDVAKTHEFFESQLEEKMESVPEDWRDMVPADMDIREKIKYVDKLIAKIPKAIEQTPRNVVKKKSTVEVSSESTPPQTPVAPDTSDIAARIESASNEEELRKILRGV